MRAFSLLALLLSFIAVPASAQYLTQQPCVTSGTLVKCFPSTGVYLNNSRTLRLGSNDETHYVELKAANSVSSNYTLTFPAAVAGTAGSVITSSTAGVLAYTASVPVANGGTGLASGTSGGIPYFSSTSAMTSSGALTANGVVLGGGAGTTPTTTAAGTSGQLLVGVTSGAPTFSSSVSAATTFNDNITTQHLLNLTLVTDTTTPTENQANINNGSLINFTGAATVTLNGINSGGSVQNGTIVYLYNNTGGNMTINNNNAAATAGDRTFTSGGAAKTLPNGAMSTCIYISGWRCIISG